MTASDMTDEIERAMAVAVAELIAHGGTGKQVEVLIAQFKAFSEEAEQAANKVDGIPD